MARLGALAQIPGAVAIGEIGLDYHYDFAPRPVQRLVLERQLRLACALDLPVILHNRESDADLRAIIEAAPDGLRGVLHCFLADAALAEWALARGLYLGVAGPITFRNAPGLAEIIRRVPLERLLIETDCPYLAPEPQRGRRNEPAYVAHVAERLAQVLGVSSERVAQQTDANARDLLRLS
jgi:TatD DNase family protein